MINAIVENLAKISNRKCFSPRWNSVSELSHHLKGTKII